MILGFRSDFRLIRLWMLGTHMCQLLSAAAAIAGRSREWMRPLQYGIYEGLLLVFKRCCIVFPQSVMIRRIAIIIAA